MYSSEQPITELIPKLTVPFIKVIKVKADGQLDVY